MLPIGPVGYGNSPYSALSAFAGSSLLVALEPLVEAGLLPSPGRRRFPVERVDYRATAAFRGEQLRLAFSHRRPGDRDAFRAFCEEQKEWLEDYVLYRALKRAHGETAWIDWEPELRDRAPDALSRASASLEEELEFQRWVQWQFSLQWSDLREAARSRGIRLIGDLPIFVAHDSADVWSRRELFHLDATGNPTVVAGVPPDYFSATGQRWGNPLYRWPVLRRSGYGWWMARMEQMLERFDIIRLDHFIGFTRYWEIPSDRPTAVDGIWQPGPGAHFFRSLQRELGVTELPLIAEDLGMVTDEVLALRDRFGLPGIRILQFAFGDDLQAPAFKPHNYPRHCVAYTGTHDNDTAVGWFHDPGGGASSRSPAQAEKERQYAARYLGCPGGEIHWDMIRALLTSVAEWVILPMQDVLGLGAEARMNRPGTLEGNWEWRFSRRDLTRKTALRLNQLCIDADRTGGPGR